MRSNCMYGGTLWAVVMTTALLGAVVSAATVTWDHKTSALWVGNAQAVDLRGERTTPDPADLRLVDRELTGESCVLAPVPGGADEFPSVSVPDEGYVERLPIAGTQLAVARCGVTYAKLLIDASSYDPDAGTQNTAGLTLTYVLSREER
jgi:hypothetical protein